MSLCETAALLDVYCEVALCKATWRLNSTPVITCYRPIILCL